MLRQRMRSRRSGFADVAVRGLVCLFAVALGFYGVMTVLLALKVGHTTVNDVSRYSTVFHKLSGIMASDITGRDRIIVAAAGVVCFLVFGFLAWRVRPRPYLARAELGISDPDATGSTVVSPRAIERAAEVAALDDPAVVGAAGRYGTNDLYVAVSLREAARLGDTLRAVQRRVLAALEEHELPRVAVNVTLTGFERSNRRELQ